jgi:hypothetical protein
MKLKYSDLLAIIAITSCQSQKKISKTINSGGLEIRYDF